MGDAAAAAEAAGDSLRSQEPCGVSRERLRIQASEPLHRSRSIMLMTEKIDPCCCYLCYELLDHRLIMYIQMHVS
jgi:hypothetical protein